MESKSIKFEKSDEGSKSPNPASKPKRERRRTQEDIDSKDVKSDETQNPDSLANNSKPRRRRDEPKSSSGGGWMTNDTATSSNRLSVQQPIEEEEPKPAQQSLESSNKDKEKYFNDGGDELLLIPDLDEDGGDLDQRVAHAPKNIHRKIPTLSELESDSKSTLSTFEDGLKLQVLISTLVPKELLQEPDSVWTFESLLREITDELSDVPKPAPIQKSAPPKSDIASTKSGGKKPVPR